MCGVSLTAKMSVFGKRPNSASCFSASSFTFSMIRSEDVSAGIDELIRVRHVRRVVDREDERLREATEFRLMLFGLFLHLLNDQIGRRLGRYRRVDPRATCAACR